MITTKQISDRRIDCQVPEIGYVQLSKFSPDFDHGMYRDRPWHVVTFGRNFATVDECLAFLRSVNSGGRQPQPQDSRPYSHGERTHSFLANEAALDACPY